MRPGMAFLPGMQVAPSSPGVISRRSDMGKYVIAWLLGVPAIVLVVVYLLFN
jgi:hypothetical protein